MTFKVLKDRIEINEAREYLKENGLSFTENSIIQRLRSKKLWPGITVGHELKSWDVVNAIQSIANEVDKNLPILDMGAFNSEILPILYKIGYKNLHGIDLNPDIINMPFKEHIKYTVGNYYDSKNYSHKYSVIMSISAIEHGFDANKILQTVSDLLTKGGIFVCTFDYSSEKINTDGVIMFDLDWKIFSLDEVKELVEMAKKYGLEVKGKMDVTNSNKVINWANREYTFGYLELFKI